MPENKPLQMFIICARIEMHLKKMEFTPCKVEKPLQNMELQEKKRK